jgi:hypothetical protein
MDDSLTTREALALCQQKRKPVTATALRKNGIRFGFMTKAGDGFHWEFDREGLIKYLERMGAKAPRGWVTVSYLAAKYKVSYNVIYRRLKDWGVHTVEYGNNHVRHVNERDFEKARHINRRITLL